MLAFIHFVERVSLATSLFFIRELGGEMRVGATGGTSGHLSFIVEVMWREHVGWVWPAGDGTRVTRASSSQSCQHAGLPPLPSQL